MNETKSKIITKKQEITKLQSEQTAMKIEIKKMQEQVTSLITLMDDFKVVFVNTPYVHLLRTLFPEISFCNIFSILFYIHKCENFYF